MSSLTAELSLDEQIGQLIVVGFPGHTVTAELEDLIRNYHVGGVILFSRNIKDVAQVRQLTHELQRIAREAGHRHPLLISIDQENGMVRRLGRQITMLPGNMALGAIGSEKIAYDVAYVTGRELKALGINMNLAPDIDVNNNPANPVIGVRSFGEDPQLVARLGVAMIEGYRAAGVISTIKHFPGHGDTAVDSHLSLPVIKHNLGRLEEIELVPFRAAIEAGADCIMTAHIYLPALMQDELLPATISPEIIRDLLRQRLGYQGVVTTDCLEMNAIANTIGTEQGAVRAIQAGVDLALVSHQYTRQKGSIVAIQQAIAEGTLAEAVVQEAAERVLALKQRLLTWDEISDQEAEKTIKDQEHERLSQQAYSLATTLVRDQGQMLPLQLGPEQRLLVLFPQPKEYTQAADRFYEESVLIEQLQAYHSNIETIKVAPVITAEQYAAIDQAASVAEMVLVVTVNANLNPSQGELVRHLLSTKGEAVIGLAVFNPYDLLAFPELGTYIATYEYTPPALGAALRVLFGKAQAQGKLPVSLPELQA